MSTLAVVLIVVAVLVALLAIAGYVANTRRRDAERAAIHARAREADRHLADAHAQDKGWERSGLEDAARRHGVEQHVVFTGYLPEDDVSRLLRAADAAVFPFDAGVTAKSGSLLAALAHGVPTIATSPPGVLDRPTEVEGVLRVPPRNTAALVDALLLVLSDRALATRLAAAGRACADRWTWPRIAEFHALMYAQVLREADDDKGRGLRRRLVAGSGIRRGGRKGS